MEDVKETALKTWEYFKQKKEGRTWEESRLETVFIFVELDFSEDSN